MNAASERAVELLVDRVTEGLEPLRERELEQLLADLPDLDVESFERAAAATELAFSMPEPPLPAELHRRLSKQAADFYGKGTDGNRSANVVPFPRPRPESSAENERRKPLVAGGRLGWIAAAACLLVAIAGWWPEQRPAPSVERSELIARAADVIELPWTATDDTAAQGASGDVVWSTALQTGYMRFRGLAANDPSREQYQLWIFDAAGDERFPVDGGVFDVVSTGEVVVPIDAKLPITRPTLFAVTVEKPGGVVVSSRERLPLLAQVS